MGRRNYLFAGSDAGVDPAAVFYSLVGTASLTASILKPTCARSRARRRPPRQPHRGVAALAHRKEPFNRNRGASKSAVSKDPIAELLPNLADFIDYGEITLGILEHVGCVATATDAHSCLAMLVRHKNETVTQLLTRLDHAIEVALNEDIFTDEING